jgi:hypothetical protein
LHKAILGTIKAKHRYAVIAWHYLIAPVWGLTIRYSTCYHVVGGFIVLRQGRKKKENGPKGVEASSTLMPFASFLMPLHFPSHIIHYKRANCFNTA